MGPYVLHQPTFKTSPCLKQKAGETHVICFLESWIRMSQDLIA